MAIGLLTGILAGKVAYDAITHFLHFWRSDEYFLKEFKAVPLTPETAPLQFELIGNLAQKAGVPMPRIFLLDDEFPNAFAIGRDPEHAAICITKALIGSLTPEEQEGIYGHEITHIKNKDILVLTAAAFLKDFAISVVPGAAAGSKGMVKKQDNTKVAVAAATMLGTLIMGSVMEQALSRNREFEADRGSGELTGAPEVLAAALEKIETISANKVMRHANENNAHLFIVCPAGSGTDWRKLFASHPPLQERVRRLLEQAAAMGKNLPK